MPSSSVNSRPTLIYHAVDLRGVGPLLLLPDDCQKEEAEDSDTSDVQVLVYPTAVNEHGSNFIHYNYSTYRLAFQLSKLLVYHADNLLRYRSTELLGQLAHWTSSRKDRPSIAPADVVAVSGGRPDGPGGGELDGGSGGTWRILAETADSSERLDTAAECSESRRYCGRNSPSSSYSSCNDITTSAMVIHTFIHSFC